MWNRVRASLTPASAIGLVKYGSSEVWLTLFFLDGTIVGCSRYVLEHMSELENLAVLGPQQSIPASKVYSLSPTTVHLGSLLYLARHPKSAECDGFPFPGTNVSVSVEEQSSESAVLQMHGDFGKSEIFAIFGDTALRCVAQDDGRVELRLPSPPPTLERLEDSSSEPWTLALVQSR